MSSHACTFSGLFSSGSDMSTRRRRKGGSEADEVAMAGSPRSGDGNKLSEKLRAKADETKEQLLRKVRKKGVCFYLHDDCGSVRYGVLVVVVAVFGTDEWGSACVSCLSRFVLRVGNVEAVLRAILLPTRSVFLRWRFACREMRSRPSLWTERRRAGPRGERW